MPNAVPFSLSLETTDKLSRDLKTMTARLTRTGARFLVDDYYQIQQARIRLEHQTRTAKELNEPYELTEFLAENLGRIEKNIYKALGAYSQASPVGRWAESIVGIGPVISAGLLAHIDVTRTPSISHLWAYAGLTPNSKRQKGQAHKYNPQLKVLCWKIGESFVKMSGKDNDVYGKVYLQRKAYEQAKNAKGDYAEQAKAALASKNIGDDTTAKKCYQNGQLPPAHIHARAQRYAAKLLLSHWWMVAYEYHYGVKPPNPYVIDQLKHTDLVLPPNFPVVTAV